MTVHPQPLARIFPAERNVERSSLPERSAAGEAPWQPVPPPLTPREKAAIVVRYLLTNGDYLPLAKLPEVTQAALAEQMGAMRLVDRETLDRVITEFAGQLESIGLSFPDGVEGVLAEMDGHITPGAANRLRRMAGMAGKSDPWERIGTLSTEVLRPVVESEAIEIVAVILSKIPVARAAELLEQMPGERARRIALAVSLTGDIAPETVRRIGVAVLSQIDSRPSRAFDRPPAARIGAILNNAPAATREDVLRGMEEDDTGFASEVRRRIFTWNHIPQKVDPRDVPRILRVVDQGDLVVALGAALSLPEAETAAEFLLSCMSQRYAQTLREEVADRGPIKPKEGEAAMRQLVEAILRLQEEGEISFLAEPEEEAPAPRTRPPPA